MIIVLIGHLWGACGATCTATNTIEMSIKKFREKKIFL